jgi:hypothetical protein
MSYDMGGPAFSILFLKNKLFKNAVKTFQDIMLAKSSFL